MTTQVDFWFDPTCPWAWMTSRWILEVEKVRDVKAVFHPMSLFILNEGRDLDPGYRAHIDETLIASRAAAAVMKLYGHDQVRDFYTALGTRLHPKGEPITVETIAAALQEAGLDAGIAQRVTTDEFDADLRAYQKVAQDLVGTDVGTPVIRINGMALFGPVISPAPKGEAAGELFDGVAKVTAYPGFFELKRSRAGGPTSDWGASPPPSRGERTGHPGRSSVPGETQVGHVGQGVSWRHERSARRHTHALPGQRQPA